jgi:hypothetical protein
MPRLRIPVELLWPARGTPPQTLHTEPVCTTIMLVPEEIPRLRKRRSHTGCEKLKKVFSAGTHIPRSGVVTAAAGDCRHVRIQWTMRSVVQPKRALICFEGNIVQTLALT